MFNYIKLSYELSFSPFNEIINLFLQFIDEYPQSAYNDEAYQYLGQALLTTRNYREALVAMEKIKHKNRDVYQAMQRVSYYRGLELFTNLQFANAVEMFDYSLKYADYNRDLRMGALYWRGEARYRLGQYDRALADYTEFIRTAGSHNMDEFLTAHYNIGYIHFNKGNYTEAEELVEAANACIVDAHRAQTSLLQKEAAGEDLAFSVTLMHGQDHLMTTLLLKDLMKHMIELYKRGE